MTLRNQRRYVGTVLAIGLLWGSLATVVAHDDLVIVSGGSSTGLGSAMQLDEPSGAATSTACLGCLLFSTGHATLQAATGTPGPGLECCLPERLRQRHTHAPLLLPLSRGPPLA